MNDTAPTILLALAHAATTAFVRDNLAADGMAVLVSHSADHATRLAGAQFPDLALVDLALADRGAQQLLEAIRGADRAVSQIDRHLPLIVLGRSGDELGCLRAFGWGADDHIAKPFSYPELLARVRALLRRSDLRSRAGAARVGALQIDPTTRQVLLHGELVELTAKEFALLRYLAAEPTRVFTKDELLSVLWGRTGAVGTTRTLDSHAARLRMKLGRRGDRFLINVWGVGYRLVDAAPGQLASLPA